MSRPLCWSSLLCSYWSFIVHIMGDAEEIGWASHHCRCTLDTYRGYIVKWTYFWKWSVAKWWQLQMTMKSRRHICREYYLLTILAYFFFILCLYVLYHSLITIGLITLEHFWCWFLNTVFVSICTSYTVMVVLIHICIFHYIYLLHIYYIIIAYL